MSSYSYFYYCFTKSVLSRRANKQVNSNKPAEKRVNWKEKELHYLENTKKTRAESSQLV